VSDHPSPSQALKKAVELIEWGCNIRLEPWQVELVKQIIRGQPPALLESESRTTARPARV
jgi:hypothetical protein